MGKMIASALTAAGGIGIFLLGMLVLTEGLKNLIGSRLQAFLAQRTTSPVSGAFAGAAMTAVLQSSSATTVAAVGFVGAGLLTFNQALGIVFGANIGTTVTGWLIALIGFKMQLGLVLLPAVLVGVLLRLFVSGWLRHAGLAVAGFGLLFVGIDFLQQGMKALEGAVNSDYLPADSFVGRLQLVLMGVAITMVTQSSSAGVATALVALDMGSISFIQAAAIVIGMDVGTTFTAAMASLGGSAATRRTGMAHVIFNLLIGTIAFLLLYPLKLLISSSLANAYVVDPQIGLVAFHSSFNALGVLVVIGFTPAFARLIVRLIPDESRSLTETLDEQLLQDATASTYAAGAATSRIADETLVALAGAMERAPGRHLSAQLAATSDAVRETRNYTDQIEISHNQTAAFDRRKAILHILDHILRMNHRCTQEERLALLRNDARLSPFGIELRDLIGEFIKDPPADEIRNKLEAFQQRMRTASDIIREETISLTAQRKLGSASALVRLDAVRWLQRVAYHVWRVAVHVSELKREPNSGN